MKEAPIQMEGVEVSEVCRAYTYQVLDAPSNSRRFRVEIPLSLFNTGLLKFQDGPLITREKLISELERELPRVPAALQIQVGERDVITYMERHHPRKSENWNRYKQVEEEDFSDVRIHPGGGNPGGGNPGGGNPGRGNRGGNR
ncbi:MAG TPA: hypothetical protein VMZ30_04445 [Pyrinomonadaceae bacterium]|nr:hypothetical protein [Pyrinomonadaceae bacterium]